jgi:hypothetical protein
MSNSISNFDVLDVSMDTYWNKSERISSGNLTGTTMSIAGYPLEATTRRCMRKLLSRTGSMIAKILTPRKLVRAWNEVGGKLRLQKKKKKFASLSPDKTHKSDHNNKVEGCVVCVDVRLH